MQKWRVGTTLTVGDDTVVDDSELLEGITDVRVTIESCVKRKVDDLVSEDKSGKCDAEGTHWREHRE